MLVPWSTPGLSDSVEDVIAPLLAGSMMLLVAGALLLLPVLVLAILLSAQPVVPQQLSAWPSLGFLYLQLLRAAVKGKKPPTDLKGKPIKVQKKHAGVPCGVLRRAASIENPAGRHTSRTCRGRDADAVLSGSSCDMSG